MADQEMDQGRQPERQAESNGDDAQQSDADAQEPREAGDGESAEAMAYEALDEADAAAAAIDHEAEHLGEPSAIDMPEFHRTSGSHGELAQSMNLLSDVALNVTIELGRTRMYVEDVLKLNANSIVELDKAAGDPVDIYVNDCHVARGEILVLNENFCVRVSEIVAAPPRHTQEQ